ncbi:hypothetical protein GBA52_015661 [Prunus armeniaca]|nr:hypothetical protein GBA52_015661 [Prunus armeniaca]
MVELEEQGPAMTALGSLLKLTEVFLWFVSLPLFLSDQILGHCLYSLCTVITRFSKSAYALAGTMVRRRRKTGPFPWDKLNQLVMVVVKAQTFWIQAKCGTLPEDMELTKQMNALGLPVSFLTNKEKRNRKAEGKRKGMRLKHPVTSQGYVVEALESSKVSVGEIVSPVNFDGNRGSSLCCMSMMGQSESSSSDVAADAIKFQCLSVEGDNPASSTEITSHASKENNRDGILGVVCNDGQDCDSLHRSAVVNDTMKISASTTDLN